MRATLAVLVVMTVALFPAPAGALRTIPDDNLAYPVLVTLSNGAQASGFFVNGASAIYLITTRHLLFGGDGENLLAPRMELTAYGPDPKDASKTIIDVELTALSQNGRLTTDTSSDVAVLKILRLGTSDAKGRRDVTSLPGVAVKTFAASGIVGVPQDLIKRFDDVLVSNRVLIFGYPSSIGLRHGGPPGQHATMDTIKDLTQLDYARPLLRSGIVAGKNQARRTLIIDCPSYWGNSGGPVLEIEQADALTWNFRVMGVVTALVPVAIPPGSSNIANSGYTVVAPMDAVLSIIAQMDKDKRE